MSEIPMAVLGMRKSRESSLPSFLWAGITALRMGSAGHILLPTVTSGSPAISSILSPSPDTGKVNGVRAVGVGGGGGFGKEDGVLGRLGVVEHCEAAIRGSGCLCEMSNLLKGKHQRNHASQRLWNWSGIGGLIEILRD